jgi:hypothetical protein
MHAGFERTVQNDQEKYLSMITKVTLTLNPFIKTWSNIPSIQQKHH